MVSIQKKVESTSFGHPGNRFYVKGVQGKESGNKGALPEGLRCPVKDEEEEHGTGKMEEEIHEMVPSRV